MIPPPADHAAAFLTVLQLADSFFPSGMYAHSQGLEGMIRRGWVRDAAGVEELLRGQIAWSLLPADGVALLNARRAAQAGDLDTLVAIDRLLEALRLPAELRNASTQAGRRLLTELAALLDQGTFAAYGAAVAARTAPGNAAVALGVIAAAQGVPGEMALLGFCHSYAVSLLGAALRLVRMTHAESQGILFRLHPLATVLLDEIKERSWMDMTTFTPQLDIAAMGHETDDLRMFAS